MANKKIVPYQKYSFFGPPSSNDLIGNTLSAVVDLLIKQGLKRLSLDTSRILGLNGISPEDHVKLNRSFLSLEKSRLDVAQAKRKEAEALERAEQWRLKQQKQQHDDEKRSKLLDLDIEEKEIQVEKARQQLANMEEQRAGRVLNVRVEPISGALEIRSILPHLAI